MAIEEGESSSPPPPPPPPPSSSIKSNASKNRGIIRSAALRFVVPCLVTALLLLDFKQGSSGLVETMKFVLPATPTMTSLRKHTRNAVATEAEGFEEWLIENANTPGARLVRLLRKHLHHAPGAEASRIGACHYRGLNPVHCFAGVTDRQSDERYVQMPVASNVSVYRMRRIGASDRLVHRLGTDPVCLPLLLAGASVQDHGVVVELGTFVGLTSRCLGMGLSTSGREGAYHAFDTFSGRPNFNSIMRSHLGRWIKAEHPEYQSERDSFKWLWEMVMADAYPSARGYAGFASAQSVNPAKWANRSISILSIDSVKDWSGFKAQLGGLRPNLLEKGSIFAMMDFMFTDQPNIVYGCLRNRMQPVYTSWCTGEHWLWVVLEPIRLEDVSSCLRNLVRNGMMPNQTEISRMQMQMSQDLTFLAELGANPGNKSLAAIHNHNCTRRGLFDKLASQRHWSRFLHG